MKLVAKFYNTKLFIFSYLVLCIQSIFNEFLQNYIFQLKTQIIFSMGVNMILSNLFHSQVVSLSFHEKLPL